VTDGIGLTCQPGPAAERRSRCERRFHGTGGISVTAAIPEGSIEVEAADDPGNIRLRLRKDDDRTVMFYYHFRATGLRGRECTFRITNAHESVAMRLAGRTDDEHCWNNPGAMASYDLEHWFRVPGTYQDGVYRFSHTPEFDVCYYASWPPYGLARSNRLLARAQSSPRVRLACLGRTADGHDLDLMTLGRPDPSKRTCWIIARQHPSESMSSFFVEGFIERMLDRSDPIVSALLDKAVIHIVPNMNPDGTERAYTRNNAAGRNLNRAWRDPDPSVESEVYLVRAEMERTGVDFCIDCHGDRELRCNFLGGPLEIPSKSPRLDALFENLKNVWASITPEYERGHPYPGGSPAEADLSMAWNWIAERFDCLSVLLEQPFKDTRWRTDRQAGWSPNRAIAFGKTLADVLFRIVDTLR
jgi:murein tripeptide amidase MpaA